MQVRLRTWENESAEKEQQPPYADFPAIPHMEISLPKSPLAQEIMPCIDEEESRIQADKSIQKYAEYLKERTRVQIHSRYIRKKNIPPGGNRLYVCANSKLRRKSWDSGY